jgi:hypothetical protein
MEGKRGGGVKDHGRQVVVRRRKDHPIKKHATKVILLAPIPFLCLAIKI